MEKMVSRGIGLALMTAVISGFAVFLNKFAVSSWGDPSVFTTAKNLTVVILLVGTLVFLKKFNELKKLEIKDWAMLAAIGFIGGFIPFLLFFKGLSLIPAVNAALIHKTLFFWIILLSAIFLKERIRGWILLALPLLLISVLLISWPVQLPTGRGELFVLLAVWFWAIENIIAKIVLKKLPSLIVAWGRMFFGSIFLLGYLGYTGTFGQLSLAFRPDELLWLIFSGVLLFGYVITWYGALKLAPVTVVSAILVLSAPITIFLDAIFVTHNIPVAVFVSALLSSIAIYSIIKTYRQGELGQSNEISFTRL